MMNIIVGNAPDNWGVWFPSDPKQISWERYLDETVEAGYEWTELGPYGYLPMDLKTLRAELDKRGLQISGTFAMAPLEDPDSWPELERQVLGAGQSLTFLGAKYLILIDGTYTGETTGKPLGPTRLDKDAWHRLIDTAHKVADIAQRRFGLDVVFHPHAETHVEYEEQIEALLEQTDPQRISLCFDTGHHAYRGGDPVKFFRKHHPRIRYLHIKSIDAEVRKKVTTEGLPWATAVAMDMFCELSKGAVDFLAFRDALRETNFSGFAVVEQDMYPAPFDKPLPIGKRNREYLRQIGIG
jgi:inosose dehydratase